MKLEDFKIGTKLITESARRYRRTNVGPRRPTRRSVMKGLTATGAVGALPLVHRTSAQTRRPNVLLIWADDLGKQGLSFYPEWETKQISNGSLETPALSKFVRDARVFDNCRSTPICWSSRIEALTGKKTFEVRAQMDPYRPKRPLALCEPVDFVWRHMPGYRSGAFGKWHLTLNFHQCLEHPVDTGLDEYALTYDLARGNHRERYWGSYWTTSNNPGKGYRLPEDRFVDDEAVAAAQVFIDRSQSKSEPWFCNLAFTLTHAPLVDLPGDQGRPSPSEAEQFRRMVTYLDKLCGEMFDFLRARNLYDDTLIVFMSDNGGIRIAGGEKGDLSELGISIPYIMRYPKMIEEGREGRLTQLADLFMTLTHVAGKPIERRYAKDQASLFVNGDREIHQYQYASTFEYNFMIADRRWKLRTPPACRTREEACRRLLLFDLDSDPFEQSPIRPQLEAGSEMRQALEAYVRLEKLAKRAGLI